MTWIRLYANFDAFQQKVMLFNQKTLPNLEAKHATKLQLKLY